MMKQRCDHQKKEGEEFDICLPCLPVLLQPIPPTLNRGVLNACRTAKPQSIDQTALMTFYQCLTQFYKGKPGIIRDLSPPHGHDGFSSDAGPTGLAEIKGLPVMGSCDLLSRSNSLYREWVLHQSVWYISLSSSKIRLWVNMR